MKFLRIHLPVFLLLLAITFAAFGYLMTTPLWNVVDFGILCDANAQSQNLGQMFRHVGFYFSQPLLQLAFLAEFHLFGVEPAGYIAVNLIIHAVNAFIVYMLVHMLFPRKRMAVLAAILFALTVGSYGKPLMAIHQLESLLLACLHLLVLYCFIRNDFRREGDIRSAWFLAGLLLYLATGLTKAASFSLIGTLIAYKAFFFQWRKGRAILSPDILVFIVVGALFHWGQGAWGFRGNSILHTTQSFDQFTWISFKNIFRYLNLMFFPIQASPVLEESGALVRSLYEARTVIRSLVTLSIVSYSFFGIVFGSKAIRFFIAWTYITLLPFTGTTATGTWLNLTHLYLASLGFCVILAAGTAGCVRLLDVRRYRRYTPYLVPALFIAVSMILTFKLDRRHREFAASEAGHRHQSSLLESCQEREARRLLPEPPAS